MSRLFISILLVAIIAPVVMNAQIDTSYLNIHWKKTTKDSASYYRTIVPQADGKYLVHDHFLTNRVQMTAYSTCPAFEDCKTDYATYYDSLGNNTAIIHWENGKKNGLSIVFNPSTQDTIDVGLFTDNKRTGEWRYYYKNGTIAAIKHYQDGKEEGLCTYYDSATQKKYLEIAYHDGMINGTWHRFYPRGRTAAIIEYKNDTLNGEAITYYKEGGISHHETYANGFLKKCVCYDEGGIIIDCKPLHLFNKGKNDTAYFSKNGLQSQPGDAYYYRVIYTTKGPEMKVEERYTSNNGLKITTYTRSFYSIDYDSTYISFDSKGDTLEEGAYNKGKRKGEWKQYYAGTHILQNRLTPTNGDVHEYTSYYKNGKIKRYIPNIAFPDNGMCYDEDGKQIECTPYLTMPMPLVDVNEFLSENLTYPAEARLYGIQGRVILKFVVSQDGSITDLQLVHGIGGGCDEEAMRVVSLMPKWKPGIRDDEPIDVYYTLPISFKLTNN